MGYYLSPEFRSKVRGITEEQPTGPSELDTLRSENSSMKSQIAALEAERDALLAAATEPASKHEPTKQDRPARR